MVLELFDCESAKAILSIPIPIMSKLDKLIWAPNSKRVFTIKSAYRIDNEITSITPPTCIPWKKLWKARAPERLKMFLWRLGSNVLPTNEYLMQRMSIQDSCYELCKQEVESSVHLFISCPIAKALW